jgi:hypothetical protein
MRPLYGWIQSHEHYMSTAFNVSATAPKQGATSTTTSVNSIDLVPIASGTTLQEPPDDEVLEAHMRQKQSPKDYFYAAGGAFAEGTYTEF